MKDLLKKYEEKKPEIVFNWKDPETEAEGWTVINSLRGGAAGGGTRMRKGLDMNEVLSLAKTMEVKFTVSGPSASVSGSFQLKTISGFFSSYFFNKSFINSYLILNI